MKEENKINIESFPFEDDFNEIESNKVGDIMSMSTWEETFKNYRQMPEWVKIQNNSNDSRSSLNNRYANQDWDYYNMWLNPSDYYSVQNKNPQ